MAGTSRVSGDAYARFCGRLVVKFHRPTRPSVGNAAVVNVTVKRRDQTRHVWIRETSVSHPLAKASKSNSDEHQKPELPACSGNSMEVTYLLAMRCSGAQEA